MKITRKLLDEMIEEEYNKIMNEVGLCHDEEGHFTKCEKGVVYSLTKRGAEDNNIDPKFVKRGTVSSKEKREEPKVSTKFGVNTSKEKSGGRKLIDGEDIYPKYHVKKYPERYSERLSRYDRDWESSKERRRHDKIGKPDRRKYSWIHGKKELDDLAALKGLYEDATFTMHDVQKTLRRAFGALDETLEESAETLACRKMGFVTKREAHLNILNALNNYARAADGDLYKKK